MPRRSTQNIVRDLMREHESIYGPITPPVPVDKIVADTLEYMVDSTADPRTKMRQGPVPGNVIAALLLFDEKRVWLRAADHQHRQRFSLAHEIGHDQLHCRGQQRPAKTAFACGDEEIKETQSTDETAEREANAFAAELLLPTHLLEPKVSRHDAQMSLVLDLAAEFDVSPVCMAIRIARAAWQPYAMVVSSNGKVEFSFRSEAMREFSSYSFIEKGAAVDNGTETANYFRSREWISSGRQRDRAILASRWFMNCDDDRYVVEEVKGLGFGQVLTILTMDYDEPAHDEEETSEEEDPEPWKYRFG
jgi:hypothetical protein